MAAHLFDCLHLDGEDLLDRPLLERLAALERVAGPWRIPGQVTDDPAAAEEVLRAALAAGHEGVVVKGASSPYEAGRRGKSWRKVKVARTFDLVVLGAEWGHGRRKGWLSNLHLGARDPRTGEFVMVGKTFKGLTDATLAWQTERFLELETHREGITVFVRPGDGGRDRPRRRADVDPLSRRSRAPLRPPEDLPLRQDPGRGRHHRLPPTPLGRVGQCRRGEVSRAQSLRLRKDQKIGTETTNIRSFCAQAFSMGCPEKNMMSACTR